MRELVLLAALTLGLTTSSSAQSELLLVPDLTLGEGDRAVGVVLDAAEDSRGRLYLADSGFKTILVFDENGRFIKEFAEPGEGPGTLMIPFVLAIDDQDRLHIAGSGGRVAMWDTDGNHLDEFRRSNPASIVRSIGVGPEGEVVLAAYSAFDHTIVDIYGPDHELELSIPSDGALHVPDNPSLSEYFGGGSIDVEPDGSILYTQQFPFLIQRYSPEGRLVRETTEGGAGWLPEPPEPDTNQATFRVTLPGSSIDVRRVGNFVLNNASRRIDESERETLLTLYDLDLDLVAKTVLPGLHSVVGVDRKNRVLIFTRSGDVPIVTRFEIGVGDRVEGTAPR